MTDAADASPSSPRPSADFGGAECDETKSFLDTHVLEKSHDSSSGTSSSSRVRMALQITMLLLGIAVFLVGPLAYLKHHHAQTGDFGLSDSNCLAHATEVSPCGKDPLTARNNGCYFDPLTFAWEPPRCYDFNLTAEFLSKQQWKWYRDANASRLLSFETIQTGDYGSIYVSWEYHRQRCAFTWMKMHRAILYGFALDGVSADEGHLAECESVMREDRDLEMTSIPLVVQYPSCAQY